MSRPSSFFAFLCVAVFLSATPSKASEGKTTLARDVIVDGRSIYLSDLLPDSSPKTVRSFAEGILIGKSPQPGGVRVLNGDEIMRLLDDGNMLNQLNVPGKIVVHRSGRLITRNEVAEAIQRTLSRNETFKAVRITPESVRLTAHIFISAREADLRVNSIELDRTLHEMKFVLVSGAEPTLLPFIATVQTTCDTCGLEDTPQIVSAQANVSGTELHSGAEIQMPANIRSDRSDLHSSRRASPAPAFVEAGQLSRLHVISGSGMQMFLTATSLERGTLGQNIRVKIQSTGKILPARIVGRGQLEAEF